MLDEPKIIEFRNFGGSDISLPFALQLTEHRNSVIYQLVGQSEGFDTAISLLHFLQEYPKVVMDREEIKLIYRPGELGIDKLVLWYHRHRGYTHALIIYDDGRVRRFRCDWLTYIWTEQK